MTVQVKLVVCFIKFIPMESVYYNSTEEDISTVTRENEEPAVNQKRTSWWKEENCPRLNKYLEIMKNLTVYGVCYEGGLEVGKDPIP